MSVFRLSVCEWPSFIVLLVELLVGITVDVMMMMMVVVTAMGGGGYCLKWWRL